MIISKSWNALKCCKIFEVVIDFNIMSDKWTQSLQSRLINLNVSSYLRLTAKKKWHLRLTVTKKSIPLTCFMASWTLTPSHYRYPSSFLVKECWNFSVSKGFCELIALIVNALELELKEIWVLGVICFEEYVRVLGRRESLKLCIYRYIRKNLYHLEIYMELIIFFQLIWDIPDF